MSFYRRRGKRAFDLAVATPLLVISLPIQIALATTIRFSLGSPVLFAQERPGLNHHPFTLLKFRSMKNPDPARGLITDEQRLTKLGAFMRSTSLDELPSLFNVVRGDMSLVGPRPLYSHYVPLYTAKQARRHHVRPGITGLAQVSGRNAVNWEDRFDLDVNYVDRLSFGGDLQILLRTITTVLRRDGISAEGHVTMPEFRGSNG
ncbi:putative sugar transferase EpsL [Corynebacterium atrinae]|uniref:sugar transferase n=1 Tax=Corynebacterium atrinae TaxID=1336740 RepID=UPI0025B61FFA|nr:sugar transferase [Corynebacterium atrinae]WJY64428.1 putative sugar transferase EpsL [Corynebacterium atrinae]